MSRRGIPGPRSGSGKGRSGVGLLRRVLSAGLGVVVVALALAACGGTNPPSNSTSAHVEDAFKFSKCMRENGIKDFPDPKVSPNGGTELSFKGEGVAPKTMEAAQQACQHFQEEGQAGPELSPREKVEREEEVNRFAKCMREHGVEAVAKVSAGGGVAVGIKGGPGAGGPKANPAAEAAQKACQGLLPGSGGHSAAAAGGGG